MATHSSIAWEIPWTKESLVGYSPWSCKESDMTEQLNKTTNKEFKLRSKKWQPSPVYLPGKFQGQRSLAGYSPWGCKELDTTERTCL